MASPRVVSELDRAESPLRTRLLTVFPHFSCHFAFIYESTPWSASLISGGKGVALWPSKSPIPSESA